MKLKCITAAIAAAATLPALALQEHKPVKLLCTADTVQMQITFNTNEVALRVPGEGVFLRYNVLTPEVARAEHIPMLPGWVYAAQPYSGTANRSMLAVHRDTLAMELGFYDKDDDMTASTRGQCRRVATFNAAPPANITKGGLY
jgi:hypothetical protein